MSKSKYVDTTAAVNVIAGVFNNPSLLSNDKYNFYEELFTEDIHKILFNSIYNLHALGSNKIELIDIENYLETRPKKLALYKEFKGPELLLKYKENFKINTFDYYYGRLSKMCLLREYDKLGIDLKDIYDVDNIFDSKKKERQEEWLDNSSLADIAKIIDDKIENIKFKYAECSEDTSQHIGDGIEDLIESLKLSPAYGYPLFGDYINTVFRGARFGKMFLRSAATGVGKTRAMVADCCFMGCTQMYDMATNKWISTGAAQKCLFIATEQQLDEIQTVCLAFLSGVNEEHILTGEYFVGEADRVNKAAQILMSSSIHFECMPDFSMSDIEKTVKRHIRENNVQYVFYDYIHSSAKILGEIGGSTGVKGLREDNILFLLASKLKEIAVEYDVFVMSSTQLNTDYKDSDTPDQNLLRGAKSIADRIDAGMIMLDVTKEDIDKITPFCNKNNMPIPNIKLSCYKNRQGQYKGIYLWLNADKGCARYNAIFATRWDYSPIDMPNLKLKVEEAFAF